MNCLRDFAMNPPLGIVAAVGKSVATLLFVDSDHICEIHKPM
jgi:hypothetical protein